MTDAVPLLAGAKALLIELSVRAGKVILSGLSVGSTGIVSRILVLVIIYNETIVGRAIR